MTRCCGSEEEACRGGRERREKLKEKNRNFERKDENDFLESKRDIYHSCYSHICTHEKDNGVKCRIIDKTDRIHIINMST